MNLTDWIRYPNDIQAGREHFRQHVKKAALYKVLCNKDTVAIRCRLVTELKSVAGEMAITEANQLRQKIKQDADHLPDELYPLDQEWRNLYKESSAIQNRITFEVSKEVRCEMAHKILENFDAIHNIWQRMDHWREHKSFPTPLSDPEEITETDPVKLIQLRNNLRANISKAKNKPAKLAKLRVWEKQLVEVEKRLNTVV